MEERDITTREQLDSALSEQRARRIERLSRKAYRSHLWAMLFPLAVAAGLSIVYLKDRKGVSAMMVVAVLVAAFAGYLQIRRQREAALKELERQ